MSEVDDDRLPNDWENPNWSNISRVHDWKNYISDEVADTWDEFTEKQKMSIARMANDTASNENWE